MLSCAGVELPLIQLLGRWTSSQDSAMSRVPQISQMVLAPDVAPAKIRVEQAPKTPVPSAPMTPQSRRASATPKAAAAAVRGLRAELEQLKEAIAPVGETFVFRPKAKILHRASKYEAENEPCSWKTDCGWAYGLSTFLRTSFVGDGARKCRKCFDTESSSSSDDSDSSQLSDLIDSADSSDS